MPRHIGRWYRAAAVGGAVLLSPSAARAQASLQVPIQFDFLNPGARSMALGSAFVGLADDATAAFTNPAGLDRLGRPQVSIEGRGRRFENTFLNGGRLSGTPTNQGVDTLATPRYGEAIDTSFGLSFVSFVYPAGRWAVAGYRHELLRVGETFEAQGAFLAGVGPGGVPNNNFRELPLQAARDLDVTNYGGSFSVKVTDKVSIGGGISISQFELDASFLRFLTPADFFGPPDFSASRQFQLVTQEGSDTGFGGSIGALIKLNPNATIGAVYRKSPTFQFSSLDQLVSTTPPITRSDDDSIDFRAPDVFSLGLSFRPTAAILIAAEYDFVTYSRLRKEYVTHVADGTSHPDQFFIDDSHEFHVGVDWTLTGMASTPSLRLGLWYDPSHSVRYEPSSAGDSDDLLFSHYLPARDDLTHFTFGAGLPLGQNFEFNAGADISSRTRLFSVSGVVYFK